MRKTIAFGILALSISSLAHTQTTTAKPTDKFSWTMDELTVGIAQGYRYDLQLDNLTQSKPLVHTCFGIMPPFTCEAPIPNITPTTHTARVRAVDTSPLFKNKYSAWSDSITFIMQPSGGIIVIKPDPSTPGGLRIVPGN